ncbi:MAG: GGDEF domain-containing protein, partial [Magnetococcales bacterium]|nr:GGDEF domain-containing protein [Magnetococcales bacterium]
QPIRIVHAGETVGELSIIASTHSSAYVLGLEPSELAVIDQSLLWEFVEREPKIARNLLLVLSGWVIKSNLQTGEQRRTLETLQGLARMDGLTGIYNRRSFEDMLPRYWHRSQRTRRPMALVMIDVDFFKRYNDNHGHQAGDRALITLAQVLNHAIRPTDFAARYGGEEFVLLLAETTLDEAIAITERVRRMVMEQKIVAQDGSPLPGITISMGLALSTPGSSCESLLAKADHNLYQAKHDGRNQCCHHQD